MCKQLGDHASLRDDQDKTEQIVLSVDNTTFEEEDWNLVVSECSSLAAKWELLSAYLGIRVSTIAVIKQNHPGDTSACWSEALQQWISQNYNTGRFGVPSWRNILKAISKVDKLLFKRMAVQHQAKVKQMSAPVDSAISCDTSMATHSPAFPVLSHSSEKEEQLQGRLYSESEDMIYKFQELFSETTESLRERKIPISELSHHLGLLGSIQPVYADSGLPVLRQKLPGLSDATSVDAVMSVVKDYCSFFNYRMLGHIICKLGSEKDKANLATYKEAFDKYAERRVFECPSNVGKMNDEGHANMFVTLDDSFNNCTLSHLNVFIYNLRKTLNISSDVTLKLCRIRPGSLKLVFQMPHFVQQAVFPISTEQETALSSLGVLYLSCGDYQFTVLENEDNGDPTADEDPDHTDSDENEGCNDTSYAEITPMSARLTVRKQSDDLSSTDSALGRSSAVTCTTARDTQFSEDWELDDLPVEVVTTSCVHPNDTNIHTLYSASQSGELQIVKHLIEEKQLSALHKNQQGDCAIHFAAIGGQLIVLKYYTEVRGYNAACSGQRGWTPLHYAARHDHNKVVQYLIEKHQVDPFCRNDVGQTPLHQACACGNIDVIRYLVNEIAKYLPLSAVVHDRDHWGCVPFHYAALYGHMDVIDFFVAEMKGDPNTTDKYQRILVHAAAYGGYLHVVKYLVEKQRCDASCLIVNNMTPLHMAAGKGRLDVARYLTLEQHCNPQCTDRRNNTPLHWASKLGHLEVVKFFIETLHCQPSNRGEHNLTPLELALKHDQRHIAEYLESVVFP